VSVVTDLPLPVEVRQLPPGLTTVIPAEYEDENGHMNIRWYLDLCTRVVESTFEGLGFTERYIRERGLTFFTAEHHLRYLAEVHAGDTVTVHLRFVARSEKVVHAVCLLLNDTADVLAYVLEVVAIHVGIADRRPVPFPADLAAAMDGQLAAHRELGWPAPVTAGMGVRRR
jgi:acyl-CoA thioester hydrolase